VLHLFFSGMYCTGLPTGVTSNEAGLSFEWLFDLFLFHGFSNVFLRDETDPKTEDSQSEIERMNRINLVWNF